MLEPGAPLLPDRSEARAVHFCSAAVKEMKPSCYFHASSLCPSSLSVEKLPESGTPPGFSQLWPLPRSWGTLHSEKGRHLRFVFVLDLLSSVRPVSLSQKPHRPVLVNRGALLLLLVSKAPPAGSQLHVHLLLWLCFQKPKCPEPPLLCP